MLSNRPRTTDNHVSSPRPRISNNTYTFEPTHPFNLEDPKSWAEGVGEFSFIERLSRIVGARVDTGLRRKGSMDWDKTHICFTKRSLLEFLKSVIMISVDSSPDLVKLTSAFSEYAGTAGRQASRSVPTTRSFKSCLVNVTG